MSDRQELVYLYCFAQLARIGELSVTAIDPRHPLMNSGQGDLAAIWSAVDREMFCGEEAQARLENPAWLAAGACRHEAVVEEAMRRSPVFPVRFASLFDSPASLEEFMAKHHNQIASTLSQLDSRLEYAVKGYLDRPLALTGLRAGLELEPEQPKSPGTRYLMQKRLESEAEQQLQQWVEDACLASALRLQKCSDGFRERKAVVLSDSDGMTLLLNWAFLFAPEAESVFRATLAQLNSENAGKGLSFVLSGPFPPYSFAHSLGHAEQQ